MNMNEATKEAYLTSETSNMSITEDAVAAEYMEVENSDRNMTDDQDKKDPAQSHPNDDLQQTQSGCTLPYLHQLLSTLKSSSGETDKTTGMNCKFEHHYHKDVHIRSGSYGRVFKCRHYSDPIDAPIKYVVKELNRTKMKPKDVDGVIREVSILHELSMSQSDGPNGTTATAAHVIQLIDFYMDVDKLYVVQVYAAGGDVFDRLTQRKHYTERDARALAKDLLQSIYAMHTNYSPSPIVHRDLKPENLLLLDKVCDTHVVVADFGFARHVDADGFCNTRCGTPSYVSPELLLGHRYNGSVDIWSIGCIIYMLLAGYPPFNAPDHRTLFRSIRAGDYVFHDEHWVNVSIHARQLITRLLCVNASKRWTAKDALECSWFTSISDEQLQERDLSNTIDQLKKFDPVNAWKRAFNVLGFCATASFWHSDVISFGQQIERWDSDGSIISDGKQHHRVCFTDLYVLTREIRKGKSGTVWECQHKSTGATYAVKIITRTSKPTDDEFVLNEVTIMQSLAGSQYVVELLDFYEEIDSFYLVMEYCIGGDLFDRVLRFTQYTESDAKDLTVMLLKAIRSIHTAGIAHRDIKPQNVLLLSDDDNVTIRIADFGYARRVHTSESLTNRVGTPSYVAPEVLKNLPHDQRVDLWSLGVVVFVLLVGYPPFLESDQATLFHKIRKGEWVFYEEDWKHISQEAKDFVQGLLVVDPNERWTVDECLRSSWIQQNPNQLSNVNLTVVLSNLRVKKHSLRNLTRYVVAFNEGRTIDEGSERINDGMLT